METGPMVSPKDGNLGPEDDDDAIILQRKNYKHY